MATTSGLESTSTSREISSSNLSSRYFCRNDVSPGTTSTGNDQLISPGRALLGLVSPPHSNSCFFFCCLCRFTFSKRAARLRGCSWLERSLPGTVTHPSHVQLFNPLVLMEAGGNATLSLTPPTQHTFEGGGTHLARRLEGAETASTRAFLLMRFVRRDLCCISVFCVASTVPQNHPV